jgi:hypothetical protein
MPRITVGVINPAETEKVTMQVPDDVPVEELTRAIVGGMNLPPTGANGRPLRYHLSARSNRGQLNRLAEERDLASQGVGEDSILQLTVEMVAGCRA